jgi:transcriptional antiterminator Rof (Rho-off)
MLRIPTELHPIRRDQGNEYDWLELAYCLFQAPWREDGAGLKPHASEESREFLGKNAFSPERILRVDLLLVLSREEIGTKQGSIA